MGKIKNFMVDYGDTSKEKKGTFTVLDTLPCAITWFYNGTNHRIEHQDKVSSTVNVPFFSFEVSP